MSRVSAYISRREKLELISSLLDYLCLKYHKTSTRRTDFMAVLNYHYISQEGKSVVFTDLAELEDWEISEIIDKFQTYLDDESEFLNHLENYLYNMDIVESQTD